MAKGLPCTMELMFETDKYDVFLLLLFNYFLSKRGFVGMKRKRSFHNEDVSALFMCVCVLLEE